MANKPISDNTAFPFETNVRAIAGLAGYITGTPNSNVKIGGTALVQSVINGGSANDGGLAVYATSGSGKELATYISLNYSSGTTSTPAILELGTPSHPSTVQISGNFNGPDPFVSPKLTFLTKNTTTGSNTVSIEPSSAATADQSLIIPPAPGAIGQALRAGSVSSGDVSLEWYTPTDDNTTYDLSTSASGVLGQIDLVGSDGTTDVVQLEGSGTVSVSSDASGLITITGASSGGASAFTTLTAADEVDWDYTTDGPNIKLTLGLGLENKLIVNTLSEFPDGSEGWLIIDPASEQVYKLPDEDYGSATGIKSLIPSGDVAFGGTNPVLFHWTYDGSTFYWTKFENIIEPVNYRPSVQFDTTDLIAYYTPAAFNQASAGTVTAGATVENLSNSNSIGDLITSTSVSSFTFSPKTATDPAYWTMGGGANSIFRSSDLAASLSSTSTFMGWMKGPYTSDAFDAVFDFWGTQSGAAYDQQVYLTSLEFRLYSPNYTWGFPALEDYTATGGANLDEEWIFMSFAFDPGAGTVRAGIACESSYDAAVAAGGATNWDYDGNGNTVSVDANGIYFETSSVLVLQETNFENFYLSNSYTGSAIGNENEGKSWGEFGIYSGAVADSQVVASFNGSRETYGIT